MMNRAEFLKRCGLIAAGVIAADQLDVLEMLAPRRLFGGADFNATALARHNDMLRRGVPFGPLKRDANSGVWSASLLPDGGYEVVTASCAPGYIYRLNGVDLPMRVDRSCPPNTAYVTSRMPA